MDALLSQEPWIRAGVFAGVFALLVLAERWAPRRPPLAGVRWLNNLALLVLDAALLRIVAPAAAVGVAVFAQSAGLGLFNNVPAPGWLAAACSIVLLDLTLWSQHRAMHRVPLLWRLHRVHHSDTGFDVTTALRFHPLEILFSLLVKAVAILALGASPVAVLVFEVLLNAMAMFSHSNLRLPAFVDGALRRLVVTPDMHRVHHSSAPDEHGSDFGFNLTCWDRLFGTYRAQPVAGHEAMIIGLDELRQPRDQRFDRLLLQPLLPVSAA